jgi:Zn-dependent peptidase ImmA (M78 family)
MTTRTYTAKVALAIENLYRDAEMALPTVEQCIVPLSQLIEGYGDLVCTEIGNLSSLAAANHLARQGGLIDVPDGLPINRDPLAGFLYATPRFGAIFVEQDDMLVRRRFTIAHEMGHYLLHRPLLAELPDDGESYLVEGLSMANESLEEGGTQEMPSGRLAFNRSAPGSVYIPSLEQMEREANWFAVELLMPKAIIRAKAEAYGPYLQGEDLVWRLATELLLSRAAIRYRLQDLRLLPSPKVRWN